jgi:flavin-dependent dehydrogenase
VETCDVIIVGGGPAGSACATRLRQAGSDVVVVDRAEFPRDKVCAGWITPQVLEEIPFDVADYRATRTFQPITGFRVGIIGERRTALVDYGRAVSFGIRRCEFDTYLLRQSGARLRLGQPVTSIRRIGTTWTVDDAVAAPLIVGAGGHFCPVARLMNGDREGAGERAERGRGTLVAAQEIELPVEAASGGGCPVAGERPELYFCDDFTGYGWCFRKGDFLNVGFGRIEAAGLPKATAAFVDFLRTAGRISGAAPKWRWHGHAYLLGGTFSRRLVGDGWMLVGDAAGLAYPQSGEGIRPAIESGLLASAAILSAEGDYRQERLAPYASQIAGRFGAHPAARLLGRALPARLAIAGGRRLLTWPWFVRDVVIDRWFLHARTPALASV